MTKTKEQVKTESYWYLRLNIQRLWNVRLAILPEVILALRKATSELKKYLSKLSENH